MEVMEVLELLGVAIGYLVAAITAYTVIGAFLASALPFEPSPLRNAVESGSSEAVERLLTGAAAATNPTHDATTEVAKTKETERLNAEIDAAKTELERLAGELHAKREEAKLFHEREIKPREARERALRKEVREKGRLLHYEEWSPQLSEKDVKNAQRRPNFGGRTVVPLIGSSMRNQSPLALAARRGDLAVVNALLKAGAHPDIGERCGPWGSVYSYSPLMAAIEGRHTEVVQALLAAGARPNLGRTVGPFGFFARYTPLRNAAESRSLPILRALLAGKADPNGCDTVLPLGLFFRGSPLAHVAGWHANYDDGEGGAASNGPRAAAALLEAGASVNFGYSFVFGLLARAPPIHSASYGNPQVFDVLEKAGARLWFANYTLGPLGLLISQSPMIALAESSDDFRPEALEANLALMRSLIARGFSPNLGRWIGPLGLLCSVSPLNVVAEKGNARMAQVLCEAGACPNIGWHTAWGLGMFVTPLYQSAGQERHEWSGRVLESGACVDALIGAGACAGWGRNILLPFGLLAATSPLFQAAERGHEAAAERLVAGGASGKTGYALFGCTVRRPAQWAMSRGHKGTAKIIDSAAAARSAKSAAAMT
mgnify:CR=1 FL=1